MKPPLPPRKRARAVAQTRREQQKFDTAALAIAVWLAILIASQLLIRLPTLPQFSDNAQAAHLNVAQSLNSPAF